MAIESNQTITIDPVNGILVTGSNDLRLENDGGGDLHTGTEVSFCAQWSQVGGSGNRTIFRAVGTGGYAELRIDATNNLIFDLNGTALTGIAIADMTAPHRAVARYNGTGNFALSLDTAVPITGTGATAPTTLTTVYMGNNNGTTPLDGYLGTPFFLYPAEIIDTTMQTISSVDHIFSCGPLD